MMENRVITAIILFIVTVFAVLVFCGCTYVEPTESDGPLVQGCEVISEVPSVILILPGTIICGQVVGGGFYIDRVVLEELLNQNSYRYQRVMGQL